MPPWLFSGDPTLFHSWKAAFKAMITDVSVSSVQEINYLHSFTSGEPQKLVGNYQKRKHHDPCGLLKNLWVELERRFGSAATITNTLLGRMHALAAIRESEHDRQPAKYPACLASHVSIFPMQYNRLQPSYHRRLAGNGRKKLQNFQRTMEMPILAFTFFRKLFKNVLGKRTIQTLILELDLPILLSKRWVAQDRTKGA